MTITEMMKKRADLLGQMRNFLDTHEDKQGRLTEDDTTTYMNMEAEFDGLTDAISRAQRVEQREAELSKPINSPLTGKPYTAGANPEQKTGRASDEYRKAMLTAMRTNFRQVSNILQEGVDADGGYLVSVEYDRRLIEVLEEENIMCKCKKRTLVLQDCSINIIQPVMYLKRIPVISQRIFQRKSNLI